MEAKLDEGDSERCWYTIDHLLNLLINNTLSSPELNKTPDTMTTEYTTKC